MNNIDDMIATPAAMATKEAWLRAIAIQLAQMNDTLAALYFGFSPVEPESVGQEIVVELEEPLPEETPVEPKPKTRKTKV